MTAFEQEILLMLPLRYMPITAREERAGEVVIHVGGASVKEAAQMTRSIAETLTRAGYDCERSRTRVAVMRARTRPAEPNP